MNSFSVSCTHIHTRELLGQHIVHSVWHTFCLTHFFAAHSFVDHPHKAGLCFSYISFDFHEFSGCVCLLFSTFQLFLALSKCLLFTLGAKNEPISRFYYKMYLKRCFYI